MRFSLSLVLLAPLFLASFAHCTIRHKIVTNFTVPTLGDAASDGLSLSVADFKSSFPGAGVVPEVLAAFNPIIPFFVTYQAADGSAALMTPGKALTTAEAEAPLQLEVEGLKNATNGTDSTRFLVYMIGSDVLPRANLTSRNLRHFLAGNLTLSTANSSLLPHARLLTNLSAATDEYTPPTPANGSGVHRYVYLLYAQPPALNTRAIADFGIDTTNRANFNLTAFRAQIGLGEAIGGTYFLIDTGNATVASNFTATAMPTPTPTPTSSSSG